MGQTTTTSQIQQAIEAVEALPLDDQEIVLGVIRRRLSQQGRARVMSEVRESLAAYDRADVKRGSVSDLMDDLGG